MSGFFTSLFGGGRNKRKPQTQLPIGGTATLRTDNRKRTPNAEETGRKAIPRPDPNLTPTPIIPTVPGIIPDPIASARDAAARQRRKGRSMRASALLGKGTGPAAAPVLNRRTLIGS